MQQLLQCNIMTACGGKRNVFTISRESRLASNVGWPPSSRLMSPVVSSINGNGAPVEFASTVDATRCAMEIQRAIRGFSGHRKNRTPHQSGCRAYSARRASTAINCVPNWLASPLMRYHQEAPNRCRGPRVAV
jgi:hypothetical protein